MIDKFEICETYLAYFIDNWNKPLLLLGNALVKDYQLKCSHRFNVRNKLAGVIVLEAKNIALEQI